MFLCLVTYPAQPQQGYPMQQVQPTGATVYPQTTSGYQPVPTVDSNASAISNPEKNLNPDSAYASASISPYPTAGGNMPPTSAPPSYQNAAPDSDNKQPL